jgi:hypothetical protein
MAVKKHFGDTVLGQALGVAIMLLAIFLGIGGCCFLDGF